MGATPRIASTLHPPLLPPLTHHPRSFPGRAPPNRLRRGPALSRHRAGVTAQPPPLPPPPPPPPQPLAPRSRRPTFRSEGSVDEENVPGARCSLRPPCTLQLPGRHGSPQGRRQCPAPNLATNRPAAVWGPRESPERASAPNFHGVTVLGPAILRATVRSMVTLLL